MKRCLINKNRSKNNVVKNSSNNILLNDFAKLTHNFIVIKNLKIAIYDLVCTHKIVNKIFNKIAKLVREAHEIIF